MPSSENQNSDEPTGLEPTLAAVFSGVLFGLLLYNFKSPSKRSINSHVPKGGGSTKNDSRENTPPLPNEITPATQIHEQLCNCRHHKTPAWKIFVDWAMLVATVGAFLAAIVYAAITHTMQQDNSHAFRTDERGWVGIDPIKPILRAPRNEKFGAEFRYEIYPRNTGRTVARHVEVRAERNASSSSTVLGEDLDQMNRVQDELLLNKFQNSEDIPFLRSAPRTLAPGQVAPVPLVIFGQEPQIFPKVEIVSYLIGRIDYADEFGIQHWVKFCFFVQNSKGELEY